MSPSNTDRDHTHRRLLSDIEKAESRCGLQQQENADSSGIEYSRARINSLRRFQDLILRQNPDIGKVYASSGQRSIINDDLKNTFWETWESDWCLIQLNNGKLLEDMTPHVSHREQPAPATTFQHISPFRLYDVKKFGKTSGETIGTISAALSVLRKEGEKLRDLPKDPSKRPSVALYKQLCEEVQRKKKVGDD